MLNNQSSLDQKSHFQWNQQTVLLLPISHYHLYLKTLLEADAVTPATRAKSSHTGHLRRSLNLCTLGAVRAVS